MDEGVDPPDRPDLYVVGRFLHRLRFDADTHTKSSLQMAVRLNYGLFRNYLVWLEQQGFVEIVPQETGSDQVHITPEGAEAHDRIVEWIRDVIGDEFL